MVKETPPEKSAHLITNGKLPPLIRNMFFVLCGLFLLMLSYTLYDNFRPRSYYVEQNYERNYDVITKPPPLTIPQIEENVANKTDVRETLDYDDILRPEAFDDLDEDVSYSLSRYQVHWRGLTWMDAVAQCWKRGGQLATPRDADEARRLGRLLTFLAAHRNVSNVTDVSTTDAMHVGVTFKRTGTRWTTLQGVDLPYEAWIDKSIQCATPYYDADKGFAALLGNGLYVQGTSSQKLIYACDMEPVNTSAVSLGEGYQLAGDEAFSFKLHVDPLPWIDARDVCESEGGALASPVSREEYGNLTQWVFAQDLPPQAKETGVFLGWNDLALENYWRDANGLSASTFVGKWLQGTPRDDRLKNCAAIFPSWEIANVACSDEKPFVCQKRSPFPPKTHGKYEEIQGMGRYAFHSERTDWYRAVLTCRSENATLAVPTSQAEADLLQDMLDKHKGSNFYENLLLHVGVNDIDLDQIWRTVEGERIYGSGFNEWVETPGHGTEWVCGVLKNGKFHNIYCNDAYMFVCKKPL